MKKQVEMWHIVVAVLIVLVIVGGIGFSVFRGPSETGDGDLPSDNMTDEEAVQYMQQNPPQENEKYGGSQ